MNLAHIKTFATALVLIGALSGCKASQTPDTASTTAAPAAKDPAAATMPAPTAAPAPEVETEAPPMAIPDTADGVWQAIDTHSAELKAAIASGALNTVHIHAFAIRDLVAALPSRSPTLSAEDQAKFQGELKFVTMLAGRLDENGDKGDKAGTQENYDKLVAVLNGITRYK